MLGLRRQRLFPNLKLEIITNLFPSAIGHPAFHPQYLSESAFDGIYDYLKFASVPCILLRGTLSTRYLFQAPGPTTLPR